MTSTCVCLLSQRERQAQREDALELTEKLDQDWKKIQALLAHKTPKSENRDTKGKPEVGRAAETNAELTAHLTFSGEKVGARRPPGLWPWPQQLAVSVSVRIQVPLNCYQVI